MLLGENIAMAISSILANKMRAVLTMLGIIIGIGSVIAIRTVGNSVTESFNSSMSTIGATNIQVGVTQRETETVKTDEGLEFRGWRNRRSPEEKDYITDSMLDEFRIEFANDINAVLLNETLGSGTITVGRNSAKVSIYGGNEDYLKGQNLELLAGRNIEDKAQKGGKAACLLSDYAVKKLYNTEEYDKAVGKKVEVIAGRTFYDFTVVGVYKLGDTGMLFGGNEDRETQLYTTLGCVINRSHIKGYPNFTISKKPEVDSKDLRSRIQIFFDRYYHTNRVFEVTTSSMESMLDEMTKLLGTISTGISVIAGIALLVGGIGVMNIMLVSISERTREIGTRKALGATNSSIRLQFIIEAMVLCVIGGIIGVIIGVSGGSLAAKLMEAEAHPSISSIIESVAFSMAIGLFFGYYPANKAAKMNPIDALTYE